MSAHAAIRSLWIPGNQQSGGILSKYTSPAAKKNIRESDATIHY